MSSFFIVGTWLSCNGIHLVLSAFSLVDSHKWVSVQSDCGLTSKSLQKNFSQSHLIVERLFNNVLKIRQNPSSKTLRTMAVKITIFSSYHGKPSFSEITTSDKRSRIYFIYIYIYIYIYSTGYPAMRLPSHSVSQAIPKLYFFLKHGI